MQHSENRVVVTYVLTLRRIKESDLKASLPFLPEDEEIEIFLQSIEGELTALDCIVKAKREGMIFSLELSPDFSIEQLRGELKPILSGRAAEIVRFISLE